MTRPVADRESLVELLCDLVHTASVNPELDPDSPGEASVAACLTQRLSDLGLEVHRVGGQSNRPSVLARLPGVGDGPSLMLNGHIDTVPPARPEQLQPRIEGDRLHGRGAYDMKGGVAACVGAAEALINAGVSLAGDLWLSFVADEETRSAGTLEVLDLIVPDATIVTEPTGGRVGVAHKGFEWIEIEIRGRAAHGSRPDLGVDANLHARRVLAILEEMLAAMRRDARHPLLGHASLHCAEIRGGSGWSTYAESCRLRVEVRTLPGQGVNSPLVDLRAALGQLTAEVPGVRASARRVFRRLPFSARPQSTLVTILADASPTATDFVGAHFWTDAALFAAAGSDTALLGTEGAGAHGDEEWVSIDSVVRLAETLAIASIAYLNTSNPGTAKEVR